MKPEIIKNGTVTIDGDGKVTAEHFHIDMKNYSHKDGKPFDAKIAVLNYAINVLQKELARYENIT